jgi:acyl carrier protein
MPVRESIRRYIMENFLYADDGDLLKDEASFLEEGIVDSTGILELVMFVEETFGVAVDDEDIVPENFDSVNRLVRYIQTQVGGTASVAGQRVSVG